MTHTFASIQYFCTLFDIQASSRGSQRAIKQLSSVTWFAYQNAEKFKNRPTDKKLPEANHLPYKLEISTKNVRENLIQQIS